MRSYSKLRYPAQDLRISMRGEKRPFREGRFTSRRYTSSSHQVRSSKTWTATDSSTLQEVLVFYQGLLHPAVALMFVAGDFEGHGLRAVEKLLDCLDGG